MITRAGLKVNTYRFGLDIYLAFIGLMTLAFAFVTSHNGRSWTISDWLINYQGGFVRRGLPGEVVYQLGHLLHVSPATFVVILLLILYAMLLLSIRSLAFQSTWTFWKWALLMSPATLAFPILDVEAGFRKEVIYLAAFSFFVAVLQRRPLRSAPVIAYLSGAIITGVLSHESLICFAPYFFAALVLSGRTWKRAASECLLPFVLGAGVAWICAHHLGDLETASHICSSLGYPLTAKTTNQICAGGAIGYLGYTREMARAETREAMLQYHFVPFYLGLGILSLAPAVFGSLALARAGFRRQIHLIWGFALLSFLGSIVLFVYAQDWGRWIYIHTLSITILLLALASQTGTLPSTTAIRRILPKATLIRRAILALVLFAYSALWTLPHVPMNTPRFGYVGLAHYLEWTLHVHHANASLKSYSDTIER